MNANKFRKYSILSLKMMLLGLVNLSLNGNIDEKPIELDQKIEIISPKLAESSEVCWPVWKVTIKGEVEFLFGDIVNIPIPIMKETITCDPGGNFVCPMEPCEDVIYNDEL